MTEKTYKWEIVLKDGTKVFEEDQKFDLAWETPGKVKEFYVVRGDSKFGVILTSGKFYIEGTVFDLEEFEGGRLGNYGLRFFKRNLLNLSTGGVITSKKVTYFIGMNKDGFEKYLILDPVTGKCDFGDK